MPSLLEEHKNIELLPPALQNAITYLAVTKFPKERKPKKKSLLPPQAARFANRMTLVLGTEKKEEYLALLPKLLCSTGTTSWRKYLPVSMFASTVMDCRTQGHVYVRPFAKLFLDLASQMCEIVVFTASTQAYADQVLAQLDPENRFVQHRLYRQHCTVINGGHVKDLRLLGRDVSKVVLADNSPISMALQPDNGIIVSAWTTDYDDKELMDLLMLLQHIATLNDVQDFLRSRYEFRKWINRLRPLMDPL
ncbi:UNVERIFIED_CONTAM: hypothetical protein H355_009345 [Colinus virginianus]|nr:hypothetical protein H355_009345 [Colinus virginianus]